MSTKNETKSIIKNEDTRARRAWIDSALASVRSRLDASAFVPSTLESLGHDEAGKPESDTAQDVVPEPAQRPRLYVAWSNGQRRSGT